MTTGGKSWPWQAAVAALLFGAAASRAHTFSTLRGMGVIKDGKLTLTLSGGAEDYLHDGALLPSDGRFARSDVEACAGRYAAALLERVVLRDERGRRVDGRVISARLAGGASQKTTPSTGMTYDELRRTLVEYVLQYDLAAVGAHMSLQQQPAEAAGGLLTQIALAVRAAGSADVTEMTLTGGGNVEVFELRSRKLVRGGGSPAGHVAGTNRDTSHRAEQRATCNPREFILTDAFKTLRGVVEVTDDCVDVSVFIPAPMVETWMPIRRAARDFLDLAEQDAAAADVARLCAQHIRLDPGDRPTVAAAGVADETPSEQTAPAAAATFLDVGEIEDSPDAAPARLSYWTSRVLVRLSYAIPPTAGRVTIEWRLFNSAVVAAPVLIIVDGQCREQDVSTYAATVALPRAAPLIDHGG